MTGRWPIRSLVLLAISPYLAVPRAATGAPALNFSFGLGGSQTDIIRAITTDAAQNIYVAGETYSPDFPGAPLSSSRWSGDAFVVKLNPSGTQILYSLVLGGSNYDSARNLAVDSAGNVYITGITDSSDFPTTAGAFQRTSGSPGIEDAFVVKVNPTGTIVYATYLGGSSSDTGYAIAIDQNGAAYVAGSTSSVNFPVALNAPQRTFKGGTDCFVAKLDPSGATLYYATLIGGENVDICKGIAVDGTGSAFVTGTTTSTSFPVAAALNQSLSGASDAFLTKLSPTGDRFIFSTYLGGEAIDNGNVIRLDQGGNVYVAGDTTSTAFPVTSGALQNYVKGNYDGFVCGIASDGSQILFASYLGGSGADSITDLFVTQDRRIAVAGYTTSTDFPVSGAFQSSFGGYFDGFVAVLGANAGALNFATYIGGGGDDRAYGIAPLGTGGLAVAGQVLAGSVSYMPSRFLTAPSGQYDGFIAALSYAQPLRFIPVTPCRVADTRNATGPFGGPAIAGGTSRDFAIPNSTCGIPATAQAYSLNITVLPHGQLRYVTVWPGGQPQPLVSLLNSLDGRIKANAAIVPAGTGGAISLFTTDTTDVVIDINGYFTSAANPSALAFYPLTPCRIVDTRTTTGSLGGPSLIGGLSRTFPVLLATACGTPTTAQAYSLNFTAVPPRPVNFLSTWPTGQSMPLASTLNAPIPTAVANAALVPAGIAGSINVFASDNTDVVTDINGYFAPPTAAGLSLYTVTPCRVLDTRVSPGTPFSGQLDVPIAASTCGIPAFATAFVVNVTAVPAGSLNYLTLWPQSQTRPLVSTLNARDAAITSNMAILPTTNGWISVFASDSTYLIIDISGYFAL